jgi:VanZ family protein
MPYNSDMKKIIAWAPVIMWMGVIFFMSSRQRISVSQDSDVNFLFFKTLHIIEYAFLYLLCVRAFRMGSRVERKNIYGAAFILTVVYAITDELHQTLVPTREGHVRDVIIDAVGAGISWIFLKHISPKVPRKLKHLAQQWRII